MSDDIDIALELMAEDKEGILYRPKFVRAVGGVTSAILLQQIIFRWINNKRQPFYKFKEPCSHKLYREGDSWCEELAFSRREFDTALSRIAARKTATMTLAQAMQEGKPVVYWTDRGRVTHYTVNKDTLTKILRRAYSLKAESAFSKSSKPPLAKEQIRHYEKPESAVINTKTTRERDDDDGLPAVVPSSPSVIVDQEQLEAAYCLIYLGVDPDIAKTEARERDPDLVRAWCASLQHASYDGRARNLPGLILSKLRADSPAMPIVYEATLADFLDKVRQAIPEMAARLGVG